MPEESGRSHLDDEGLNAVLDGEAQADAAAHAHACAECSARLDRFRQVARAVATPVMPVDAERRRAAVAAALESEPEAGTDDLSSTAAPPAERPSPTVPPVTVLARHRTRRPGRLVGWSVAAAAVAALALGIPRLDDGLGGSGGPNLATGSAEDTSAGVAESSSQACQDCASTGPGFIDGGELGDLDQAALDGLAVRLGTDGEPGALSGPADASDANEAARTDDAAPPADAAPPGDPAPAPGEMAAPGEASALGGSDLEALVTRCDGVARERDPELGVLGYGARARIDDVAVVVLGFTSAGSVSPGVGPTTVLALAVTDCRDVASATA